MTSSLKFAKERVTQQTVKDIAMGISERENIEDFKASDRWLTKFMERNEFELLEGEEEDPFLLEEGLQETIVLED